MPPAPAVVDPNANRTDVSGRLLSSDENNGTSTTNPLIVTSGASRTAYNDNVNNLNTTKTNLTGATPGKQTYNFVDTSGKVQSVSAASPEEAMASAGNIDPKSGVMTPATLGTDGKPVAATTDATSGSSTSGDQSATAQTNDDGSTTNADGSTSNVDGTVTMPDGTRVDASLASTFKDSNARLDQGIEDAKGVLTQAAATLQNDPVATNAISAIMSKFDDQIKLMKAKNAILLGASRVNSARSGALQYAPEMNDNFMSEEQDAAVGRVSDLITKESQAALTAEAAYKKGDVAAFTAASNALTKAQDDKTKSINDLLTQTDKIVKERQAQAKIDQAATKATLATDVTTSTKIAAGLADSLKKSGITDPTQVKAYVEQMAHDNGITNPEILNSALVTAQAAASKADLAAQNTESTIAKRNSTGSGTAKGTAKGGTDGGFSYSADDIGQYTTLLNHGGKGPDGTTYAPRGKDDGFADPNAYVAAYTDWIANNGTPQGFAKKFPVVGNVNPSSYSQLPAAIQPKAKTAATAPKYVTTPAK